MTRSFSDEAVEPDVIERILRDALRSPTAGNAKGTAWVALVGPAETATYWTAATDRAWRERNPDRYEGLQRAGAVLLAYSSPDAYVSRYAETDKADPQLGSAPEAWPVPYWHGDAAFGVMAVLLCAVDTGLGACVLGAFRGAELLSGKLGVPEEWQLFCAVALGHPDGHDRPSRSRGRAPLGSGSRIHWGVWGRSPHQATCERVDAVDPPTSPSMHTANGGNAGRT